MGKGSWTLDPTQPIVMIAEVYEPITVNARALIERLNKSLGAMPEDARSKAVLILKVHESEDSGPQAYLTLERG